MTITQDSNLSAMLSSQLKQIDDIVQDILKLIYLLLWML